MSLNMEHMSRKLEELVPLSYEHRRYKMILSNAPGAITHNHLRKLCIKSFPVVRDERLFAEPSFYLSNQEEDCQQTLCNGLEPMSSFWHSVAE